MSTVRCGVLERGEVPASLDGASTLRAMLTEAELLDGLGYSRLWFAEHHASDFAHSSPELLVAAAGARTSRIRVGSAGVLLYFYSPYKVASLFRTLSSMHDGRVDLGLAAGWSSPEAQDALRPGFDLEAAREARDYASRVGGLMEYLDRRDDGSEQAVPCPTDGVNPRLWLLGSSQGVGNMSLAAEHGTSFCYMLCFGPEPSPSVVARYREGFARGGHGACAEAAIAGRFVCRETDEEAIAAAPFEVTRHDVVGSPERCDEKVRELLTEYGCQEFILLPRCGDRTARRDGFGLLAEAMGLSHE